MRMNTDQTECSGGRASSLFRRLDYGHKPHFALEGFAGGRIFPHLMFGPDKF